MPRARSVKVARRRHKKILKLSKGYVGSKSLLYRTANEQVMRARANAYKDRKRRKREFRKLWITRINAAAKANGTKYSVFMHGLTLAGVQVNRKMLSEIAIHNPEDFTKYVEIANEAIANKAKEAPKAAPKAAPKVKATAKVEKVEVKEESPKVETPKKEEAPKVEKVEVKESAKVEKQDYSKLLVADLKDLAAERGLAGYSALKKAELVALLEESDK